MNCRETERVLDAYVAGELDDSVAGEIRAHLEGCAGCRASAEGYERALQALRDEAAQSALKVDAGFYRGLERRLDAAGGIEGSRPAPAIRWHFVGSVAAAAAAVFVLAVYVIPGFMPPLPGEPPEDAAFTATETPSSPNAYWVTATSGDEARYAPSMAGNPTGITTVTDNNFRYVPVSTEGQPSGADAVGGRHVTMPRYQFPTTARNVAPLFEQGGYVTLSDYRRLQDRITKLESRVDSLEQGHYSDVSK